MTERGVASMPGLDFLQQQILLQRIGAKWREYLEQGGESKDHDGFWRWLTGEEK